jgi:DNA-binding SARP family transcriptional activator
LQEAVELYRGEFLEGFSIHDSADFEEWLLLKRQWLPRHIVDALRDLIVAYEGQGAYEEALP